MIANFDSETHNVQVFLETGDLAVYVRRRGVLRKSNQRTKRKI